MCKVFSLPRSAFQQSATVVPSSLYAIFKMVCRGFLDLKKSSLTHFSCRNHTSQIVLPVFSCAEVNVLQYRSSSSSSCSDNSERERKQRVASNLFFCLRRWFERSDKRCISVLRSNAFSNSSSSFSFSVSAIRIYAVAKLLSASVQRQPSNAGAEIGAPVEANRTACGKEIWFGIRLMQSAFPICQTLKSSPGRRLSPLSNLRPTGVLETDRFVLSARISMPSAFQQLFVNFRV